MNEQQQILLSAWCDGELAPAERAEIDRLLAGHSEFAAVVAQYRRMDAAAAALPVPGVNAALRSPMELQSALSRPLAAHIQQAVEPVPGIPAARFDTVWAAIAALTVAPTSADRALMDAAAVADGEAVASAPADVEMQRQLAAWKRLDAAAAALPVPQISTAAGRETLGEITARTAQSQSAQASLAAKAQEESCAPAVSVQQWERVWSGVAARTTRNVPANFPGEAAASSRHEKEKVVRPARWRWVSAAGIAAMLAAALLVRFLYNPPPDSSAVVEIPAGSERYEVAVEYMDGDPVVCYWLKPEARGNDTEHDWRWLPD